MLIRAARGSPCFVSGFGDWPKEAVDPNDPALIVDLIHARLPGAARDMFLTEGYEATTTRAILNRPGSSKGAMYHQFASKAEMLEDIFREASVTAIRNAGEAAGDGPHPDRLTRASLAWLGELNDPATRRILVELGP